MDHFYGLSGNDAWLTSHDYRREGIAGYVFRTQQPASQPIYRFWHPVHGDHFYCLSSEGEYAPQLGYIPQGVVFYLFQQPEEARHIQPFYRFFSSPNNDHFYTSNIHEGIDAGYNPEGNIGFIATSPLQNTVALYRYCRSAAQYPPTTTLAAYTIQRKHGIPETVRIMRLT